MVKRVFSLLLCLVLCLSILPAGAFADGDEVPEETVEELPEESIPEEETPVEEIPAEESPIEEAPIAEETPAEPVEVTFTCAETADLSALTVYDASGAPVAPEADAATGEALYGRYALLPGDYSYSFAIEGFEALENVPFTVADAALTVSIVLMVLPAGEAEPEPPVPEDEPTAEEAVLLGTSLLGDVPDETPGDDYEITYSELQELLAEDASIKLSALLSALGLSIEMAEVTAAEASDESVFTVVKDAVGDDWTVSVRQAPETGEWISVTVGTPEYIIVVTNDSDGLYTKTVTYLDAEGVEKTAECICLYDCYTGPLTDKSITGGWYYVDGVCKFLYDKSIEGNVHLILTDGSHYYSNYDYIFQENAKLTVYGQTVGNGIISFNNHKCAGNSATLTVNGCTVNAPSISLPNIVVNRGTVSTGKITGNSLEINGGVVTSEVVGAEKIASISCQSVTINGGIVTATGGQCAAGIGGDKNSNCGTVIINGGTVTATGGFHAAGIGGGEYGHGGDITITGGTVTATAGDCGSGIGGGYFGNGGNVTISGGTVTATGGGDWGTGIGPGGLGRNYGQFNVQNEDRLLLYAGKFREQAKKTTAAEYRGTRDVFVCIDKKVEYVVSHQWQTADGTGYEQREQESLYAIAGFPTEAKRKSYEGLTCQGVTQTTVAADGKTVVPIRYNRNLYDIEFDNNSIGPKPNSITARYGATVTVNPGAMEAAGYVFNGWFEDEACTVPFPVPQEITMPLNGMILHAGWTGIKDTPYKVEHWQQKADGTGYELKETTPMTGTTGQPTAAKAKTYSGFTAAAFTQQPISGDGSTVIEIKYNRNRYTITFNANGHGTAPGALKAMYGAPVTKPANPEETGYTFKGWFEDKACTKAFTFTTMPLGGKTLYAKWTANVYSVTFDGNFTGSSYKTVIKETYGKAYILPKNDPTRKGYNFTGWYTKSSKGEEIEVGDIFPLSNEYETLCVYAHWRVISHVIGPASYEWTGDTCTATYTCTECTDIHSETETVKGVYVKDTAATCTTAETGHYEATFKNTVFEKQSTAKDSVTKGEPLGHDYRAEQYDANQHRLICRNNEEHTVFEAHIFNGSTCTVCGYTKGSRYLIIYGADGVWTKRGTAALPFTSDAPFDKFVSVMVDGAVIPESSYTAEEGSTKVNLLPAYLETLSVGEHSLDIVSSDGTASTTFTVKPVQVFTVSFNMNGHGTQVPDQYVEMGSTASRPADPRAGGYTFFGWYTDASCSVKYDFRTPVTRDTVLYARWVQGSIPMTGDGSRIALWAALLALSGAGLAGAAVLAKKKKQEE